MKTFFNLVQEVQKPGLCHRCGGCVTFCTAVNYGALDLDEEGKPRYSDMEKCIECGLCYSICPEIEELDEEVKRNAAWSQPIGRILETTVVKTTNPDIMSKATDGGVVTALLVHLLDTGKIDGAIVAKPTGPFQRTPCLAKTRDDLITAAGFYFDTSQGVHKLNDKYITYSSIEEFAPVMSQGLRRVALVGTPCQINSVRRMQLLEIMPADSIRYCFGLFCSGNFTFGDNERSQLASDHGFDWDDVEKVNIKEDFQVHLASGKKITIPLAKLDFMKRYACRYCSDYAAEFADISFGGIGADEGWTTVITRTPVGRAVFADARSALMEEFSAAEKSDFATYALSRTRNASAAKKNKARLNLKDLGKPDVNVRS